MNRFSRFAASALALSLVPAMLMGCGKKEASTGSDLDYIKQKGTLVVGITDFAPMDYQDADGSWIGFDADMAKKFAKSLGVDVEFVEIDWDNKIMELDAKSIDCVWNGMTISNEVKKGMSVSNAYCKNTQVVVVKKELADNEDKLKVLNAQRENEKSAVERPAKLRDQIAEVHNQIELAERQGDLAKMSELQYGVLPKLQRELEDEENKI